MLLYEPDCENGWSSLEEEVNGECPECGIPTADGMAAYGCNYSPVICDVCNYSPCNGSCQYDR